MPCLWAVTSCFSPSLLLVAFYWKQSNQKSWKLNMFNNKNNWLRRALNQITSLIGGGKSGPISGLKFSRVLIKLQQLLWNSVSIIFVPDWLFLTDFHVTADYILLRQWRCELCTQLQPFSLCLSFTLESMNTVQGSDKKCIPAPTNLEGS